MRLMRSPDFPSLGRFRLLHPAVFLLQFILYWATTVLAGTTVISGVAEARSQLYRPPSLPLDRAISDQLSNRDIPTGRGSFARDYVITCQAGDRLMITVNSTTFDPMVAVIAPDGSTIAENDDGEDGTTNAALSLKIPQSDRYTVRVQNFGQSMGQSTGGSFQLQVIRLPALQTP